MNVRVIPCLLLRNGGVVKSVKFKNHRYVGDPINAVRIFNDKEVDELVFLDIGARPNESGPKFDLLSDIASEAFMPFAYGGGIRDMDDVHRLYALGVEKLIFNTVAHDQQDLVKRTASMAGRSGVVASVDVKRSLLGRYTVVTECGTRKTGIDPVDFVQMMEEIGAGEILLNSMDKDGTLSGYDLDLISQVADAVTIPVVAIGGAGDINHFREAVGAGASAVAAGSMFVFQGKHKAVLITYPGYEEIRKIWLDSS